MRNPRHQVILLGLLCQGLSWDDFVAPAAYGALWVICLTVGRDRLRLTPPVEGVLLFLGCAAGLILGRAFGRSTHFFIGHGLALVQLARLTRPLTRREMITSLLIAVFHLGVACTFLFDLRFVGVLAAALVLAPRAFMEIEAVAYPTPASMPVGAPRHPERKAKAGLSKAGWWRRTAQASEEAPGSAPARNAALGALIYAAIALVMAGFFLVFPRGFLRAPALSPRSSPGDQNAMLDSVLDPARSGLAQSSRVLFHIEGERLGYLRCRSLTEFDGARWSVPASAPLRPWAYVGRNQLGNYPYRRVRVKNAQVLGRILPTDGHVVFLVGRFFWRPLRNAHGGIEADSMWNTANNVYEYWIDPSPQPTALLPAQLRAYTQHPPISSRLAAWLDQAVAGATNSLDQARRLERRLRDSFAYELGAPELGRQNPIEEFVFQEKRGHCERFAGVLGALLRAKGIPTRVVIGYVPTSHNAFSGGFNIRFKDAHAWTEGYFPEAGWVQFDATPRANAPPEAWNWRDLLADLDYAWSSYVVNFDAPIQGQLFTASLQAFSQAPGWMRRHQGVILGVLGPAATVLVLLWLVRKVRRRRKGVAPGKPSVEFAAHYYGQMLRALARRGIHRQPQQTPIEFAHAVAGQGMPLTRDVRSLTDLFCAACYGEQPLSPAQQAEAARTLARIQQSSQESAVV